MLWLYFFLFLAQEAGPIPPGQLITDDRLGPAQASSRIYEFRQEMEGSALRYIQDYAPGYSALCADEAGVELICAAYTLRPYVPPFQEIAFLRTRHPRYQTKEGVGAGSSLSDVSAAYGPLTILAPGLSQDSEYATTVDGPRLRWRIGRRNGIGEAGIYPGGRMIGSTTRFHDDAIVTAVDVLSQ